MDENKMDVPVVDEMNNGMEVPSAPAGGAAGDTVSGGSSGEYQAAGQTGGPAPAPGNMPAHTEYGGPAPGSIPPQTGHGGGAVPPEAPPRPENTVKYMKRRSFRSGFIAGMISMLLISTLVVVFATAVTRGFALRWPFRLALPGNGAPAGTESQIIPETSLPAETEALIPSESGETVPADSEAADPAAEGSSQVETEEAVPAGIESDIPQETETEIPSTTGDVSSLPSDQLLGGEGTFTQELAGKMTEIDRLIDGQFIFPVSRESMMTNTLKGYMNGLEDVYSVYYTPEEFTETISDGDGTYVGIGVAVKQDPDTKVVTALTVYEGSPAAEGGMQNGDILVKVDGEDITRDDLNSIVARIRGEENTTVVVTVYRDGNYIDITMVRKPVDKVTVEYEMKENGVGYIRLTEFDNVSVSQMQNALNTLHSQGMQRLVLDLRDNPGGLLNSVLAIADMFLPQSNIFYSEDKQGNRTNYDATSSQICTDPMVILINGNSASASEVLSGSLKDHDRAVLMGVQSFGKGIVQTFFPLSDGSAVKLTTAHYFTPNGTDIHGVGIEPNVEVQDDLTTEADEQLDAALAQVQQL